MKSTIQNLIFESNERENEDVRNLQATLEKIVIIDYHISDQSYQLI
jgi:hypothetical protein